MVLFSCEALVSSVKHHLLFSFLPPLLHFTFFLTHPAWGLLHFPLFHPPPQMNPVFPKYVLHQARFSRGKWDETFSATFEGNGVRLNALSFFDCYAQNFVCVFLQFSLFSSPHPTHFIDIWNSGCGLCHHYLEVSDCISLYVYTMVTFTGLGAS